MFGKHIFCLVRFPNGSRGYYRAAGNTFRVGDFVVVPAGWAGKQAIGQIVGIQICSGAEAPQPVSLTPLIISKAAGSPAGGVQRGDTAAQKKTARRERKRLRAERKRRQDAEIDAWAVENELFDDDN